MTREAEIAALFAAKESAVRATFDALMRAASELGPVAADPKKTSIHLVNRTTFAGVHPRTKWLDVTMRSAVALKSPRIRAQQQVSRNRWHQDVRLTGADDIDAEFKNWLRDAYELSA